MIWMRPRGVLAASAAVVACSPDSQVSRDLDLSMDASAATIGVVQVDAFLPIDAQRTAVAVLDATLSDLDAERSPETDSPPPPKKQDAALEASSASLRRLAEHACQHALHGPFRDLTADAPEAAPQDVSRPHTAYRLHGLSVGAGSHALVYVPRSSGEHVVLANRVPSWSTREIATTERLYNVSEACALLPVAVVVSLVTGEAASLAFRPYADDVLLVIEPLELTLDASGDVHDAASDVDTIDAAAGEGGTAMCRSSGPCSSDSECCQYCHDYEHCH
jgi:hypothetical protein